MRTLWRVASLLSGGLILTHGPKRGSALYLTFDGGPHPVHTPHLLDVLQRHGAKATFYLVGHHAQAHPDVVRRLLAEGHAIGNHSMDHPKMRTLGLRQQWREIDRCDAVLAAFDGRRRHPFRPPNGRVTASMVAASVLHLQKLALWSFDSLDYKLAAPQVVERLQARPMTDGDVILFHDDAEHAARALELLLPRWAGAGFRFPVLA